VKKLFFLTVVFLIGITGVAFAVVGTPTPVAPQNGIAISTRNPTFVWTGVADATTYYLQVSTDVYFSNIIDTGTVTSTSISTTTLAPTTYYDTVTPLEQNIFYWRVSADSGTTNSFSGWSSTYSVIIDTTPPLSVDNLISPLNNLTTNYSMINFSWGSSTDTPAGIKNYILQISTTNDFSVINRSSVTANTSAILTLYQSSFTWRVNVQDNALNYTTSTVNYFLIIDTTPPASVVLYSTRTWRRVNLSWNAPGDDGINGDITGGKYEIRRSTVTSDWTNAFTTFIDTNTSAGAPQVYISTGLTNGVTYYFQLRTRDEVEGNWSGWSNTSTGTPVNYPPNSFNLFKPTGNVIVTELTPLLTWYAASDPDQQYGDAISSYTVFYSSDNFLTTVSSAVVTVSSFTPTTNLTENTTHWWYVKAYDLDSAERQSSFTGTFRVNASSENPNAVSLLWPINNQILAKQTTTFYWNPATDPDPGGYITEYEIVWAKNFALTLEATTESTGTASYLVSNLADNTTYWWRVKAKDDTGLWSTVWSTWSVRVDFNNIGPSTPLLSSPTNYQIVYTSYPVFGWQASSSGDPWDIVKYTIEYSTYANFSFSVSSAGVVLTSYSVTSALVENATYYWKVTALDYWDYPTAGYYVPRGSQTVSDIWLFRVNVSSENPNAVSLLWPINNQILAKQTTTFYWNPATDPDPGGYITEYEIVWAKNFALTLEATTESTGTASYLVSNLADNTTYWWRVKAKDDTGLWSTVWSTWSVRVDWDNLAPSSPTLSSPTNYQIVYTSYPAFSWSACSGNDPWDIVRYRLEYSSAGPSFTIAVSSALVIGTSTTPVTGLLENSTYWWRVYALDYWDYPTMGYYVPRGSETVSETWKFFVNASSDAPNGIFKTVGPIFPVDNQILTASATTFDWVDAVDPDPGDSVVSYTFYLSTVSRSGPFISSTIVTSEVNVSDWLLDNTTRWWYVKVVDNTGRESFSSTWTVRVDIVNTSPNLFNLVSPSSGTIIDISTPTFIWGATGDPDPWDTVKYTVEYSTYADFSFSISSAGVILTTYPVTSALVENATYYWKVTALDYWDYPTTGYYVPRGSERISETWKFFVNTTSQPPQAFEIISPGKAISSWPSEARINTKKPTFDWYDAVDPDPGGRIEYYVIYYSTVSNLSISISSQVVVSRFEPVEPLKENTTYYWKVIAFDETGYFTGSTTYYFYIPIIDRLKEPVGVKGNKKEGNFNLSWSTVTLSENLIEGKDIPQDDLERYNIYRSTNIEEVDKVSPSTMVVVTSWVDRDIGGKTYYYLIRAVDTSGIESKNSMLIDSGPEGNLIVQDEKKEVNIIISKEGNLILYQGTNLYGSDLRVSIVDKPEEKSRHILGVYEIEVLKAKTTEEIKISDFNFLQPVGMKFSYAGTSSGLAETDKAVFRHNGVEYINLGGKVDINQKVISLKSKEVGKYRVQEVMRATAFEISSRVPRKIFTPDGLGPSVTEKFTVTCENPKNISSVTGEIYDITGAYVTDMKVENKPDSLQTVLSWDGKDKDNNLCRDGVYIYQIKAEGKTINGTVILAK